MNGEIPDYVRDGIERQDLATLESIADLVDELIEERSEPELDDVDDADVDPSQLEEGGSTTVVKKQQCGKESCNSCPHGPYKWEITWNGKSMDWTYIEPVEE